MSKRAQPKGDEGYERIFGYHLVKKGERMGKSKHGGLSSNTFDDDGSLTGESPFHPVEDAQDYLRRVSPKPGATRQTESDAVVQEVIASLIVILAQEAVEYAAPYAERWVKTRLIPSLKKHLLKLRSRFTQLKGNQSAELVPLAPMLTSSPTGPHTKEVWVQMMTTLHELDLVGSGLVSEVENSAAFGADEKAGWVELYNTLSKPNQLMFRNLGKSAEGYLKEQRALGA